jgi:bile acid:Na+ symporter, BASS family
VLIEVALPLIVIVIMFSLGLGLRIEDFTRIFAQPKAFAVGAFNQLVMVPVSAVLLAILFRLPTELALGLMILAACPGGLMSNSATKVAGGNVPLSISLTAIISLMSTITLPLVVAASVWYFSASAVPAIDVTALGLRIFILTTAPVALGVLVTRTFPNFVAANASAISRLSFWLFIVVILAAVIANWQSFVDNMRSLLPVLVALNVVLLAVGWLSTRALHLGPDDATAIAIETGTQNGALGIAVGLMIAGTSTGLPETTLPSAIYSVSTLLVTGPFIFWRYRVTHRSLKR